MYLFTNKTQKKKDNSELQVMRMNYLITKNNILIKQLNSKKKQNNSPQNKQSENNSLNIQESHNNNNNNSNYFLDLNFKKINCDELKISNKVEQTDNYETNNEMIKSIVINDDKKHRDNIDEEKLLINMDDMVDVPKIEEKNNQQLFVLKNNIISLIKLSCITNTACKNILDELNKNEKTSENNVVKDIVVCVSGISEAIINPIEQESKQKKFTINKNKIEKIKEDEKQYQKKQINEHVQNNDFDTSNQLINYKEEILQKIENIFNKATNNISNDVSSDISQWTNIIMAHSRKTLHEKLDSCLNAFFQNV
jgi:hypothetical protein